MNAIRWLMLAASAAMMVPPVAAVEEAAEDAHLPFVASTGQDRDGVFLSWQPLADTPVAVSRPAAAWHDGTLYLIGGEETGGVRDGHVQRYRPDTGTWDNAAAPSPIGVSNSCAAVIDGIIHMPGGFNGVSLGELQTLDTGTGFWSVVVTDPMPAVNSAHGCAAANGRLYVFGGSSSGAAGVTALVYDPAATPGARWSTLPPLPFATQYAGVASAGNHVYVAGGTTSNLGQVERFDLVAGIWEPMPAMITGRGGVQLAVLYNRLYAVGGGWSSYLVSVEHLDLANPVSWAGDNTALNLGRRTFGLVADHGQGGLIAAAGWNGTYMNSVERRPRERGTWIRLADGPVAVSRPGGALVGGAFYLIGGEESGGVRNGHTQRYDIGSGRWSNTLPAMPDPVSNTCAAHFQGQIYVPGGWNGVAALTTLRVFDVGTGTWSVVASDPLPAANAAHGCAFVDGRLYVLGGSDIGAVGTTALAYDPAAAPGTRWSSLTALPFATNYPGVAGRDGEVFVAGGTNADLASAARYGVAGGSWTPLSSLNQGRGGVALLVKGDQLVAIAGGWASYLASVETLDLDAPAAWISQQAALNIGRRTFAAAGDGSTMIVAGGWNGSYLAAAEIYFDDAIFMDDFELPPLP